MEENKYYTPELEEFYVGFECEVLGLIGAKEDQRLFSQPTIISHKELLLINKLEIRVKYLDKEDFESLGWKIKEDNTKLFVLNYEKQFTNCDRKIHNKVFIHYNLISKWALITTGNRKYTYKDENKLYKSITRFCGYIKNKSEFKKLMKQLNIITK